MRGLAPGTIQGRLSVLAFYARINGYQDYSLDYCIKKMIEGWSKERGRVQDNRAPLSPAFLEFICKQWELLCRDEYEIVLFKAASLLTFLVHLGLAKWSQL